MFEIISIPVENSIGEDIVNNRERLFLFLREHIEKVYELLRNHWYRRRGSIQHVTIDERSVNFVNAQHGYFSVQYQLSFTFACEDITHDHQEKMKIAFSLSEDLKMLTLQSEVEPERVDEL